MEESEGIGEQGKAMEEVKGSEQKGVAPSDRKGGGKNEIDHGGEAQGVGSDAGKPEIVIEIVDPAAEPPDGKQEEDLGASDGGPEGDGYKAL